MDSLKSLTIEDFANILASNSPAPGGGSVAALCAGYSSSLSSMVFSLTTGKKFYLEYDEKIRKDIDDGINTANKLKIEFLDMIDEDVTAFNMVMEAFKMPKETLEEKNLRSQRIQESYTLAMEVPLRIARNTINIFDLLDIAVKYGNPNAISDAGVGSCLALTAMESAVLNVSINLNSLKDIELKNNVSKECFQLLNNATLRKNNIIEIVNSKL
jgi:formiminotetrahydrofolate cyclodeaminase